MHFKKHIQLNTVTLFIRKKFIAVIVFLLVGIFVFLQLFVLSTVGTQGDKVSELRREEANLQIANNIKRAHILALQSNDMIESTAKDQLQMQPASVIYLDADKNISALK